MLVLESGFQAGRLSLVLLHLFLKSVPFCLKVNHAFHRYDHFGVFQNGDQNILAASGFSPLLQKGNRFSAGQCLNSREIG